MGRPVKVNSQNWQLTNWRLTTVLLSHHFHNYTLVSPPVELGIEDSLPRTQIKLPGCNRHDHFVVDEKRLQMRVAVILARLVMLVVLAKGCQMLQPLVDILD